MVVLTPIERETLQFFLHISQILKVSTFGNTADIYTIVHPVPHACQHITVDQSHSSVGKVLQKVDTLNICEICKKKRKKKLGEFFSLYRRKNYHDPLSSLFVANF